MKKYYLLLILFLTISPPAKIALEAKAENIKTKTNSVSPIKTFAYHDDKFYRLKEYDEITFLYEDSSGAERSISALQVLPTGTVTLPRVGEIQVRDLTVKEIKDYIISLNLDEIKNLDIIVNKHQRAHVFVIGAVHNPGSFSVKDMRSVYDAIATSGGFNRIANKKKVKIVRQRKDGSRQSFYINFPRDVFEAYDEGIGAEKYLVQENDIIYVPESFLKKSRLFVGELLKFATAGLISGAVSASLD